jgi:adenine-specific DNA methylase
MKLDTYTFGNSHPAFVLVERLEQLNSTKIVRSVSQYLVNGNVAIKALENMEDSSTKIYLCNLLRQDILRKLKTAESIPENLRSFIANILITKLKIIERDVLEYSAFVKGNYEFDAVHDFSDPSWVTV